MNAVYLAKLCQQAYADDPFPDAIADVGAIGPRAFVLDGEWYDTDTRIIVFRGTNDLEGWLEDVQADRTKWNVAGMVGMVHGGFKRDWEAIKTRICRNTGWRHKIILAGHSLGGAIATLAASYFGEQVRQVVTFGSPRVGDSDFAKEYDAAGLVKLTTRFVNFLDPVPWVPFWLAGFRHVCPPTWHDGEAWSPWSLSGYALAAWKRLFTEREKIWQYHGMEQYVAALESATQGAAR